MRHHFHTHTHSLSTQFSYDAAGRLTAYAHSPLPATLPSGLTPWHILRYQSASYQYDANGNRTRALYQWPRQNAAGHNRLERQLSLPADSNRIQSLSQSQNIEGQSSNQQRSFQWSAAGQLLSDGEQQHQYNAQGRKASSQVPDASGGAGTNTSHYLYNGYSQRVRKASEQGHTDYSYGPAELGMSHWPLGIYQSTNTDSGSTQTSTEILYLPTAQGPLPVAAEIDGQLYAIEADHLHTPRRLSNAQGQGVWQWITSGFGEVPASHAGNGFVLEGEEGPNLGPAVDFALRYPGQVHDAETGLHYNHHRYYDPKLTVGYTQADPIGLDGGWNRFGYVGGDPVNWIDLSGLDSWCGPGQHAIPDHRNPGHQVFRCVPHPFEPSNKPMCVTGECAAGLPPSPKINPTACEIESLRVLFPAACGVSSS